MTFHEATPDATIDTDIAAERAVLGAMMADCEVVPSVGEILQPADFAHPAHREMFAIMTRRYLHGEPVDEVAMAALLAETPVPGHRSFLAWIGGAGYLHTLMQSVPVSANAPYYAELVRKRAVRRRVMTATVQVDRLARDGNVDPDELVDRSIHVFNQVHNRRTEYGVTWRVGFERAMQYMREVGAGTGLSFGFKDLEKLIGTARPGQMIVIAGRPGSGKTVFAGSIARNIALRQNTGVLYSTLEMSAEEMMLRNLSAEGQINYNRLRDNCLTEADNDRLDWVAAEMETAPLVTVDVPKMSVVQLVAAFNHHGGPQKIGLVVADYLQLFQTNGRLASRQEQVAELSRDLKLSAKEMGVPLIVLAQLNRANESRTDKRPQLSDLRESGAVEQDADIVIMVHRPDYYDEYDRPGEADLMVVKNRHGPTGTVVVASQLYWMRFMDLAV